MELNYSCDPQADAAPTFTACTVERKRMALAEEGDRPANSAAMKLAKLSVLGALAEMSEVELAGSLSRHSGSTLSLAISEAADVFHRATAISDTANSISKAPSMVMTRGGSC